MNIDFTPEESEALFFQASENVAEIGQHALPCNASAGDIATGLLWLGIQAKVMRALREAEEMRGVEDELANWTPEGAA
jgi:hypothetical protein